MAFLNLAPQFGAKPSGKHLQQIRQSSNYKDNRFVNQTETRIDYSLSNVWGMIRDGVAARNTSPKAKITAHFGTAVGSQTTDSTALVTWFGHSAVLIQLEGKRIFLDPMLGPAASPVPVFGRRFKNDPALDINTIDTVDAVIFSHDHYDHLDYFSVQTLKNRAKHFYTPLGLSAHLIHWGVDPAKITELDWWESVNFEELKFIATPARHFSGRSISDSNKTQWASWVIQGTYHTLYFSGDSGYGPHFREIGEKYGPFDLAMMECGQYNERWKPIHMLPDQTIQAHLDVKGKTLMPIHWGAFSLAPHSWTEPVEKITTHAKAAGVRLITPEIGQPFVINQSYPTTPWWANPPQEEVVYNQ